MLFEINNYKGLNHEAAGFVKVKVPGSKSITNRAILLASLAEGSSLIKNVLFSEDSAWMIKICRQLGAKIEEGSDGSLFIEGCGGRFKRCSEDLYVGNSGICARFLSAALVRGEGEYVLRGNARMQERPMEDLIHSLREWGVKVESLGKKGYLPLRIHSKPNFSASKLYLNGSVSSQFLSALMILSAFSETDVEIEVVNELVSSSYVAMTAHMMKDFGVEVEQSSAVRFFLKKSQCYRGREYTVPTDASSASYFFALAAITGIHVVVDNLEELPLQSDLNFVHLLSSMGAEVIFDKNSVRVKAGTQTLKGLGRVDMSDMSDMVPTLAVVALFAKGSTEIRNVSHIRGKECDRIHALSCELKKLGAKITVFPDGLKIDPPSFVLHQDLTIKTYDDHRIAMAFAILSKRFPGIKLEDPSCVSKTFPNFFEELGRF